MNRITRRIAVIFTLLTAAFWITHNSRDADAANRIPFAISQPVDSVLTDTIPDLEAVLSQTWTDGFEFVRYLSKDIPELMGISNAKVGENQYLLLGGTVHEGGTHIRVTVRDGHLFVADSDRFQMFPEGDRITFDSSRKYLLFRNSTGALDGLLQMLPADTNLYDLMVQDILRFMLAGSYTDPGGRRYIISPKECIAEGFPVADNHFTLAQEYDFPVPFLVFKDGVYKIDKTQTGLEAVLARYNSKEDVYEGIKTSGKFVLTREQINSERRFPLLSQQILTQTQVQLYAGDDPVMLALMRNEIFAAHGYIFKNKMWRTYFQSTGWYHAQYDDVTPYLSEIEKINIELIRQVEARELENR